MCSRKAAFSAVSGLQSVLKFSMLDNTQSMQGGRAKPLAAHRQSHLASDPLRLLSSSQPHTHGNMRPSISRSSVLKASIKISSSSSSSTVHMADSALRPLIHPIWTLRLSTCTISKQSRQSLLMILQVLPSAAHPFHLHKQASQTTSLELPAFSQPLAAQLHQKHHNLQTA